MKKRNFLLAFIVLLTAANIFIYYYRDDFQYQPYSNYQELYKPCINKCGKEWGQYMDAYPQQDLTMAQGILKDSLHFSNNISTEKKIVAIANLVYTIFLKRHGYPSETFRKVTPFQQFQLLTTQDSGKLWCGNVAQIFAYFCWAESITCRSIEILKPNDHHVVNECYLPEIKKWILVDVPHNLFLVKDSAGSHLDLQTFGSLVDDGKQFQSYQHVSNKITVQSALKMKDQYFNDYYLTNYQQAYYHTVGGQDIYSVKNKVRRYFLPHSWYKIYRERAYSNTAFYIKQILFFLWLVSILVLLSFLIKNAIMIFSKRGR